MIKQQLSNDYDCCVIDIGSPKLGNIGWCYTYKAHEHTGTDLNELFEVMAKRLDHRALLLGLEAPLFVPLREDLLLATKARKGEGRRPWSAGAGAQVLAMNLPIMIYLFRGMAKHCSKLDFQVNEKDFEANTSQVLLFEALVSGQDKGSSHVQDAQIMAHYCHQFAEKKRLPPSILEEEPGADYFNLAAAALLRCHLINNYEALNAHSAIYKPTKWANR